MKKRLSEKNIRRLITLALLLVLIIIFGTTTSSFFSLRNVQQLLRESAYVGLVACGVSFIMIGGGIDLSSGGIICVTGILAARMSTLGVPGILCICFGVLIGCLCGLVNGLCITKLHINDFITTLASGYVFGGFALMAMFRDAKGRTTSPTLTNDSFLAWGGKINGWYFITIAWIILSIAAYLVHNHTIFGQQMIAAGSDPKSASMSGVNTDKIRIITFIIGGAFCGIASCFTVAYQATAYLNLGGTMGFQAVACCVMGGIVLGGGKGDALCAVLGTLFMTIILNGLYKFGFSTSWQYIAQGALILIIILFDAVFGLINQKRLDRLAQKDFVKGGDENVEA